MNDQWTDRLSEYLDGELDSPEQTALESHLDTCAACQATLAELRRVVARAKTLEDPPPRTDLWQGVAERIGREKVVDLQALPRRVRRFSFSVPQLIAASLALAIVSSGGMWLALHRGTQSTGFAQTPAPGTPGTYAVNARWEIQTDLAIAELQEALTRNEAQLDTGTVRVVRQNLAVIDRAIAEAQKALKRDPNSGYLRLHLANTMRQKIELLRRANALAASES
jgi:anti-sigma factor RsiW